MYRIKYFGLFSPPLSFNHILQNTRNIAGCTYLVAEKSKIDIEYKDIALNHYHNPQYQQVIKVSASVLTNSKLTIRI